MNETRLLQWKAYATPNNRRIMSWAKDYDIMNALFSFENVTFQLATFNAIDPPWNRTICKVNQIKIKQQ